MRSGISRSRCTIASFRLKVFAALQAAGPISSLHDMTNRPPYFGRATAGVGLPVAEIQPHGVVVAVDMDTLEIEAASENVADWFGPTAVTYIGEPLRALLGDATPAFLEALTAGDLEDGHSMRLYLETVEGRVGAHARAHRVSGLTLVELERA